MLLQKLLTMVSLLAIQSHIKLYLAIHWRLGVKPAGNLTFRQAHNLKVVGSNPTPETK